MEGVQRLVDGVSSLTDHVDILFANAGATWVQPFDSHSDESFARVIDLNLKGVFNTIRAFSPLLRKGGSAEDPSRVLITSSIAASVVAFVGDLGTYSYGASKAAVVHLGRMLAVELGPQHITVNMIAPGFFPTQMCDGIVQFAGGLEEFGKCNPLGRVGRAEDIAGAVIYLTSKAGAYINGTNIEIDGGYMWARGVMRS
ncbi:hypothetical protein CDD80_6847 [Ophiocordyceps camponoti-rufipedis]|uniref:Uncharacterized protein n=1 Tax=Ophiocordyceps camponoti-rufipedis TaxID=2004952 RepID=A0A2C5ZF60_9HYPO|nr:hypothetical protein CDD80_6847 [Ophiocordyceps camponoti-rufipedis]